MIRARFLYRDKLISGFEMRGHADSGEYGQDIVCSASTLSCLPPVLIIAYIYVHLLLKYLDSP